MPFFNRSHSVFNYLQNCIFTQFKRYHSLCFSKHEFEKIEFFFYTITFCFAIRTNVTRTNKKFIQKKKLNIIRNSYNKTNTITSLKIENFDTPPTSPKTTLLKIVRSRLKTSWFREWAPHSQCCQLLPTFVKCFAQPGLFSSSRILNFSPTRGEYKVFSFESHFNRILRDENRRHIWKERFSFVWMRREFWQKRRKGKNLMNRYERKYFENFPPYNTSSKVRIFSQMECQLFSHLQCSNLLAFTLWRWKYVFLNSPEWVFQLSFN